MKVKGVKVGQWPVSLNDVAFPQDGVVDFREYVIAISMLIKGSAVEKLRWSFQLYDKDQDGAITRQEMLEIMQVCVSLLLYKWGKHVEFTTQVVHLSPNSVLLRWQAVYKMSLAAALTRPNSLTAEECTNRVFARLDKDNNGEESDFCSASWLTGSYERYSSDLYVLGLVNVF